MPMELHPDGTLTVSSVAGLAWLNTNDALIDFSGRSLQTEITYGHQKLSSTIQNLEIKAGDNAELMIEVLAPDWSPEYNIQLQYRIIKKEDKGEPIWQDVNEQLRVSLPFLGAGDYEIQFRKRTGLNNEDFIYHTVTIHKNWFWYQTAYLYPVLLVTLVIIGYLLYLGRMLALRRKNKILSEKIIEATGKLQEKNLELQKTVQTRDSLIMLFNHDLSTPLFYINQLAKSLAAEGKLQEPDAESLMQLLASSTQDLEELMNEMLLWIQIQQKNTTIQLTSEAVNVVELAEMNFDLFRDRISQHNLATRIMVPSDITLLTDKRLFNSILYNLITNAIKYTRDGVVQIDGIIDHKRNDQLVLLVRSQSNTSTINPAPANLTDFKDDSAVETEMSPVTNGPTRQIGLQLVKSFADMLNIAVAFDNTADGVFTVKIAGINLVKE